MSPSLPPRPNLHQIRQQAKDLLRAYGAGSADAISRIRSSIPRLKNASDQDVIAAVCTLQDMQYVLSVEYGFANWGELKAQVEAISGPGTHQTERLRRQYEAGDRSAVR